MGRGVDILWIGVDIPWVRGSKYHGQGVNILCVRGRYPMGRRLDIPWLEESSAMGRE